jgi:cobalt-zinc-cadmium efflux system membrane fusion protein
MMETNHVKRNPGFDRIAGSARLLIALIVGVVLGAALYAKFIGTDPSRHSSNPVAAEPDKSADPAVPSDVIQISPESQRDVGIAVESADLRSLQVTLSATGTVTEDPGRVAHIRPLARGLVEKIYARLGDRVSAGDPLIEYDNVELGLAVGEFLSAQAEVQRSLTDLEVKKKILERSREMLREGAVAQTTYDLREAEYKDAEAKVAGTRATAEKIEEQIHRFGWTDRDLENLPGKQGTSGHSITHSVLKAPFSGVVTSFHAAESEVVEPGTELIAITDMSWLWVLADIYEKDLAHIRTGKAVRVRVGSYPGKVFEGRITYVADAIDPKSRTAKVRCLVQNNSGLLKLEMFATVEIPIDQTSAVLAVPDSSLQQIDGQSVVFVRNSDTEFQKREVRTGIQSQGYIEIRSGLTPGESVASQGSFVLKTAFLRHLIGEKED